MANILDYLDWREDLTLAQDPFNEVDNLILAELSFVDFGGIVPGPGEGRAVPLWKAAEAYFAKTEGRPIDMGVLVPNQIPELLRRAAASPRFRDMKLNGFVDHLDTVKAVQRRIAAVWSNDGPGFHEDILSLPRHIRLAERIHTIVPKSSVVGMLLEHEEDYTVVDSSQQGLMQHDGFSWEVLGNHFVRLHSVTRQAQLTDQELRGWVQGLTVEQREKFVDSAFQVLEASGAQTLTDLKADSFKAVRPMVRALKDLDKETREALLKFMSILFMSNLRMTLEGIQEETEKSLLRNGKKAERSAGKKG